jgi:hypothetical protein
MGNVIQKGSKRSSGLRNILTIWLGIANKKINKGLPPTQAKTKVTETRYHLTVGASRKQRKKPASLSA